MLPSQDRLKASIISSLPQSVHDQYTRVFQPEGMAGWRCIFPSEFKGTDTLIHVRGSAPQLPQQLGLGPL